MVGCCKSCGIVPLGVLDEIGRDAMQRCLVMGVGAQCAGSRACGERCTQ
jgi:hypothetical protein